MKDFFSKDSQIVGNYVYLINEKRITLKDVPILYNLREAVKSVLDEEN